MLVISTPIKIIQLILIIFYSVIKLSIISVGLLKIKRDFILCPHGIFYYRHFMGTYCKKISYTFSFNVHTVHSLQTFYTPIRENIKCYIHFG